MAMGQQGTTLSYGASPSAGAAEGTKEEAKQALQQTAEQVRSGARDIAAQAKERGQATISSQKDRVADHAEGLSGALQRTAGTLRDEGQLSYAHYVEAAGERLAGMAQTLRERDVRGIVSDVERFARREPLLFFGGALAAGLLLSRFLKSSGSDEGSQIASGHGEQMEDAEALGTTTGWGGGV